MKTLKTSSSVTNKTTAYFRQESSTTRTVLFQAPPIELTKSMTRSRLQAVSALLSESALTTTEASHFTMKLPNARKCTLSQINWSTSERKPETHRNDKPSQSSTSKASGNKRSVLSSVLVAVKTKNTRPKLKQSTSMKLRLARIKTTTDETFTRGELCCSKANLSSWKLTWASTCFLSRRWRTSASA